MVLDGKKGGNAELADGFFPELRLSAFSGSKIAPNDLNDKCFV